METGEPSLAALTAVTYLAMQLKLTGQSVAVFGAANGIGRAIAQGFVADGARVRGFDRDPNARPLQAEGDIAVGDVTSC